MALLRPDNDIPEALPRLLDHFLKCLLQMQIASVSTRVGLLLLLLNILVETSEGQAFPKDPRNVQMIFKVRGLMCSFSFNT